MKFVDEYRDAAAAQAYARAIARQVTRPWTIMEICGGQTHTIVKYGVDTLLPHDLTSQTDLVAGPATGGALLAHTIAGLLDGRRSLTHPPCRFAPFHAGPGEGLGLRRFYAQRIAGQRVLIADDVRNTGGTFERCAALIRQAGGTVVATAEIYDRQEAARDLGVPNYALVEYKAPANYPADACPLCHAGMPVTTF